MAPSTRRVLILLALIGTFGPSNLPAEDTYTNPVIGEIGPADPCVILFEGKYYLYPTGDNRSYHVYYSTDLVHWVKGPRVFRPGETNVWAPDVVYEPGSKRFYLYYTVNHRIGVAVADRPDAMFVDRGTLVSSAIDAHLFRDRDGKCFLYYVKLPGFRITVSRMKTPLLMEGRPVEIITPTEPWETKRGAVTEGPWMLKHRGTYYLLYSGTGASSLDYAVGYATATDPMGPFTKHSGNPIVRRGNGALGPGHCCVTTDRAGNLWMVYHQQKDDSQRWNRFLCIDPLRFDENGILHGTATRATAQPAPAALDPLGAAEPQPKVKREEGGEKSAPRPSRLPLLSSLLLPGPRTKLCQENTTPRICSTEAAVSGLPQRVYVSCPGARSNGKSTLGGAKMRSKRGSPVVYALLR